jgi:hypothetical protein
MLRPLVHEFIWVITESPDGSHMLVREAARKLGGRILEMPRGLYQAWNAGIAATRGEFIYISTIGDTIQAQGLAALHGVLQETRADVVMSPPFVHPPSPKNTKQTGHWPLFFFASALAPFAGRRIPQTMAMLMQILSGASGLTGSAASCLFRASALSSRPFPINHHHYGDTAWLYKNLPEISLAYWPQPLARFVIHGAKTGRVVDKMGIYEMMLSLAANLPELEHSLVRELVQTSQEIDAIRDPHPRLGWWIWPRAWLLRIRRQKARKLLMQHMRGFTS